MGPTDGGSLLLFPGVYVLFEGFNAKFRRITSCAAAIVIVMGLVTSSVMQVKAVTPAEATIAAALVSYVGASGVRLWREGVGNDGDTAVEQMIHDISILWSDFVSGYDGSAPSWESITGVSANNGKYIITYDTAQTFQGFTDWFAEHYNMQPYHTYNVFESGNPDGTKLFTLPSDELAGLNLYSAGVWAMPAIANPPSLVYRTPSNVEYSYMGGSYLIACEQSEKILSFCFIGKSPFGVNVEASGSSSTQSASRVTVNGVSRPNEGSTTSFSYYRYIFSLTTSNTILSNVVYNGIQYANGGSLNAEVGYVVLAGDAVGDINDLFATAGRQIADMTYDLIQPVLDEETGNVLTPGQSLVIDVGAHADASEDEMASIVGDAYVAGVDDAVIPFADSYPAPIAGVEELYPQPSAASDVENLGLPALGRALTTRFPFCIPWDVAALYKSFNATPVRPVFTIDVVPSSLKSRVGVSGDTSVTLDLGDPRYDTFISIIRWGCLGSFIFGLAYATKRIIWTTGG